jgi:ammonia channel protein AmtB
MKQHCFEYQFKLHNNWTTPLRMLLFLQTLVWQLTGLLTIIVWTAALCFVMFFTLKKFHILRVPFEAEMKGI